MFYLVYIQGKTNLCQKGTIIGVQKHAILRDRDIYLQEQEDAQKKGKSNNDC